MSDAPAPTPGTAEPPKAKGKKTAASQPANGKPSKTAQRMLAGIQPEYSETLIASEFVQRHQHQFRWTPGMGWMAYDGGRWLATTTEHWHAVRLICDEFACAVEDRAMQGDAALARRIASAKTVSGAVQIAQADPRLYLEASIWDANPAWLNTPGGLVDLQTGERRPHCASDYLTKMTTATPDWAAGCPTWMRFLEDAFEGDATLIEFSRVWLGYCVTGDTREQQFAVFHGAGSNGKNTLLDLLLDLLGDYASKVPSSVFMAARGERHPTEIAQLRGLRLAIGNEVTEGCYLNEELVKELVGDKYMRARYMRMDFFSFRLLTKIIISGNNRPRLRNPDYALERRLLLFPFNRRFVKGQDRDEALPDKLRKELPGILAWIISGAVTWYEQGLPAPPAPMAQAAQEYIDEESDLQNWIDECCRLTPGARSASADLYASFRAFKQRRGEVPESMTRWGSRMWTWAMQAGVGRFKSGGRKGYVGIVLAPEEMDRLTAGPAGTRGQWDS